MSVLNAVGDSDRGAPGVSLGADVEWISECFVINGVHEHVSVYLVRVGRNTIVIDSGAHCHLRSLKQRIERATKGGGIQALILSHSDYPHSGNVAEFRAQWGNFEIVASCADPEIQGLPYATRVHLGQATTVLGRRFTFVDPPLADRSHTTWIYDHTSGTLFSADGFGSYHVAGQCSLVSGELPGGIRSEHIASYHRDTFPWLRYVDPVKLRAALEHLFRRFPVRYVAPVHGHPVSGDDLPAYMNRLIAAVDRIAQAYSVTL